ncbi:MAG: caspase family protein [Gammaproteobacteria bacterium]|nr:caspase family protein [Gammaproteobacteria bacterium]
MIRRLLQRCMTALPVAAMVLLAQLVAPASRAAERVALVIGNADYPTAPLRNAVNDARAVSRALGELGFEVITLENGTKAAMEQAVVRFAARLEERSTGLFYYAGHGVQANGRNYLIPVDASIGSEREMRVEAVGVHLVLDEMGYAGNRMNIVILDACRNNPFERRLRGATRGLAAIDAAAGTIIAYATAPGSVALDGEGANGLYTEELLRALREPGLEVEEVFKQVRVGVARRTNQQQIPWESSSLTGSFYFRAPAESRAAFVPDSAVAPASRFDGEWVATRSCEAFKDLPAFVERHTARASGGEFVLERGERGQPGSHELRGRAAEDGSLVLTGTAIAAAQRVRGRELAVFLQGRFDGERFLLQGQFGKRPCEIVLARAVR